MCLQLPDVDAVLHFKDTPSLGGAPSEGPKAKAAPSHPEAAQDDVTPPPLLGMCSNAEHYDITFPDWSFWGLPVRTFRGPLCIACKVQRVLYRKLIAPRVAVDAHVDVHEIIVA